MHHAGEVAADRVHRAGEVAGERVAHASEAAGQKVILASEAAEGTVAEAQTRAVHAKNRIVEQAGHLGERIRKSTPTQVRETGTRAVDVVRKNPRKVFAGAGSALVGLVTAVRRRGRRSGGDGDSDSSG
jgi:vacuolar-type H+-ATPase subunit H